MQIVNQPVRKKDAMQLVTGQQRITAAAVPHV